MPRSLSLGNGNILLLLDRFGQLRDLYFPYVGLENHIGGRYVHKVGVWVEGQFSWMDSGEWEIRVDYLNETLASQIKALNQRLSIELNFTDLVYNEKNIFVRKVDVKNLSSIKREIRVFFNQQFDIYENSQGNTGYFDPDTQTLIHYKGRRVFMVGGRGNQPSFDDFSVGLMDIEGKEGTWKDAEDGLLSKNPIEHGPVDSVVGFTLNLDGQADQVITYWLAIAEDHKEIISLFQYIHDKTTDHLVETTEAFWRAWVNKYDFNFYGLDEEAAKLFKKSLLIIRTHVDNNGAILASGDSEMLKYGRDTYSYMWPRDGAFTALALDKAGYFDVCTRFFEFLNEVVSINGYLYHKYRSDKSLGSSWHPWFKNGKKELAIQEDETALALVALWEHYSLTKDLEFIESIYNSFIKKTAQFMSNFRDSQNKLPLPSYDIWEEKFGTSTFTSAAVYGALISAGNFAKLLNKFDDQTEYFTAAHEIKESILKYLFDEGRHSFRKLLVKVKAEEVSFDSTVDVSSFYGVFRFNILDTGDQRLSDAYKIIKDRLFCKTDIGGVARYEGDNYFKVGDNVPGNPWYIPTLWMLQYDIALAQKEADLEEVKKGFKWVVGKASSAGLLSEQLNPYTGEELSVSPLTWSHAEYVLTIIKYLEKLEELGVCKDCYPVK